jgi:hypothetical protein
MVIEKMFERLADDEGYHRTFSINNRLQRKGIHIFKKQWGKTLRTEKGCLDALMTFGPAKNETEAKELFDALAVTERRNPDGIKWGYGFYLRLKEHRNRYGDVQYKLGFWFNPGREGPWEDE